MMARYEIQRDGLWIGNRKLKKGDMVDESEFDPATLISHKSAFKRVAEVKEQKEEEKK